MTYRPLRPAAPAPAAPAPASTAPATSSPYGRYTLNMDPEVVAALSYEQQGLADLNSEPMPSMQSTASYDQALAHLQEDRPIQLERMNYAYNLNKGNLEHSNEIAKRNIINSLAGRGMLTSGETGYQQGEQERAYGQAVTDLTTKNTWAHQDLDKNIQRQQEAISAARAAANSAYSNAVAQRQHGIQVSQRNLHNSVTQAYINAYQRVISNPALYLGNDPSFDPRNFLGQIPTG